MDNAKDIGTKRKSNIDDAFGDSFEVFLPNKLKEKSIMSKVNVNSRNNSNRRKKCSPTTSVSSTSQESYDTDMDQVMAVCLCKDKDESTLYNSVDKQIRSKNWKDLTHKMKRQPLLITRTTAEREAILSQKLAIILVENNENDGSSNSNYSLIDMEDLIQSDLLLQQWCKTCRLWSAAKLQTLQIKDFYIAALSNYVEFDETCNSDKDVSLTFDFVAKQQRNNEEIVIAKNDTEATKLSSHDCVDRKMDDHSAVDMFDVYQTEEECYNPHNVVSAEIASQIDDNKSNGSNNETNTAYTHGISASPAEIIELSSSPSSDRTVWIPSSFDKRESPLIFSPAHSFNSIATDQINKNLGMLDRIGVTLLSQQWDNLFNSNEGDIIVLLENEATFNVHRFVLSVRCRSLIYEINEDRLLWNMYSLEAAKAFFRYLYTGKCDHLWYLTTLEKTTVKRLARLYQLNHLEEILIKLHDTTYVHLSLQSRSDRQVKESINKLNYSSSLLLSNSPKNQTSRLKPQKSINSEEYQLSDNEDNSAINTLSNTEINSAMITCSDPYEYVRSPTPSYNYVGSPQTDSANKNVAQCNVKKSLEAYFQESFPELTNLSGLSTSVDINPASKKGNISVESDQDSISLLSETPDKGRNRHLIDFPLISSQSPKSWSSSYSSSDKISAPSTSFPLSPTRKSTTLQLTPSCSSSEVYFSKNVTPFPDYDSMITPLLKRELKKFGLKGNLGSAKAKLLLKYIYDQIHPVVESDKEQENFSSQTQSSSAEQIDSLTTLIGNIVKSNKELYTHILLFKPIWLENFYQLLKEQGIVCSANQLKDALNTLGITYRTKNTRKIKLSKKSKRKR